MKEEAFDWLLAEAMKRINRSKIPVGRWLLEYDIQEKHESYIVC